MDDSELADVLIGRLNKLIENANVRKDIGVLIETRVACSQDTLDHPSIQTEAMNMDGMRIKPGATPPPGRIGFLGVLNGLVGTIPEEGPKRGWGYITAEFDDDGQLLIFKKTVNAIKAVTEEEGESHGHEDNS
jgi:hypothetical protein